MRMKYDWNREIPRKRTREVGISINLRRFSISLHPRDWHRRGAENKTCCVGLPPALAGISLQTVRCSSLKSYFQCIKNDLVVSSPLQNGSSGFRLSEAGEAPPRFKIMRFMFAEIYVQPLIKPLFNWSRVTINPPHQSAGWGGNWRCGHLRDVLPRCHLQWRH